MRVVVTHTKDPELQQEVLDALPEGFEFCTEERECARAIAFVDMDTMGMGEIEELAARSLVICVTRHSDTQRVMQAVSKGAYEIVLRPLDPAVLADLMAELDVLSEELMEITEIAAFPPVATCVIVGQSPEILDVCKRLARLSQVDVPVLVTGETGSGKELIAESIAQFSNRFGKPFLVINCAAVPETLLESELFGFEKGSFTGAVAAKSGLFKVADGGTVLLDEVGELPLSLQAKLLRFLQTQAFYPIGSTREVQVDVRVISATNRDIPQMIERGRFREDLYHRLRVAEVHVPPLRQRRDDIPPLVRFFIERYKHTAGRSLRGITRQFMRHMLEYEWPGNIRELENTIRSAIAMSRTGYLTSREIRELSQRRERGVGVGVVGDMGGVVRPRVVEAIEQGREDIYERLHGELDRHLLAVVMEHTGENQSEAARLLGINRLTLRRKLQAL